MSPRGLREARGEPGEIETLRSAMRRASPSVPAADIDALVEGNTAFALDFYRSLRAGPAGNLFYSPYSISLALVVTWAGAEGETSAQMADVLRLGLPPERLHRAFNALDRALASPSCAPRSGSLRS